MDFDVAAWLRAMKLDQYSTNFVQNGFEDMDTIRTLTDEELKTELQITTMGHRRKIMLEIARLQVLSFYLPITFSYLNLTVSQLRRGK